MKQRLPKKRTPTVIIARIDAIVIITTTIQRLAAAADAAES